MKHVTWPNCINRLTKIASELEILNVIFENSGTRLGHL